jgi:5-methyltetrahydrofolate--homocysteine methyltransferase
VLVASRAVGTMSGLLDQKKKVEFDQQNRADQEELRRLHARKRAKPLVPLAEARAKKPVLEPVTPPRPSFTGLRRLENVPLAELVPYIDWTFFFTAWELPGRFPAVLDDPRHGAAARDLYDSAKRLLDDLVAGAKIRASGVYGFWPAAPDGDDVVLYTDDARTTELRRFHFLRQQQVKEGQDAGKPHLCLADFVEPSGDFLGAFAVTAGLGVDELARGLEKAGDDYSAILVKALADRLAEAFAEMLHERVRREWGYETAPLSKDDLVDEKYRGIRPAFGYPACPDHTEKRALFDLLGADDVGLTLTEHYAMWPAAAVSGVYFQHPKARYFNLGRIGKDQVEDYARRKGVPVAEVERWLNPSLGYEPAKP